MQLIANNTFSSLDCYFHLRFPSWHNHFNTSPPSLHPHLKQKQNDKKIVNIYTSTTHLIGTGHLSQHWVHFLQFLKYVCTILNHGRDKFDWQQVDRSIAHLWGSCVSVSGELCAGLGRSWPWCSLLAPTSMSRPRMWTPTWPPSACPG